MAEIKKKCLLILIFYFILMIVLELFYRNSLFKYSLNYIVTIQQKYTEKTFLYKYIKIMEKIFDQTITLLITIFLCIFFSIKDSFIFQYTFSMSAYFNSAIKLIYMNKRPFWENNEIIYDKCSAGFGNPSGHSARSTMIYLSFYFFLTNTSFFKDAKNKILKYILIIPFLIIVFTIMYSRVFDGKHTFNQIFFGFSWGIFFLILWYYTLDLPNYNSTEFLMLLNNQFFIIFFAIIFYTFCFSVYFITNGISDLNELNKELPEKCRGLDENEKFFKTGLLSCLKSSFVIGGFLGFILVKRIGNSLDCNDDEELICFKNDNLSKRIIKIISFSMFFILCNIFISKIKIKSDIFLIVIIINIIQNILKGFLCFGPGIIIGYFINQKIFPLDEELNHPFIDIETTKA